MKVNEYFDGNVKSIGFENEEGRATVGVMAVGEYDFGTAESERVVVISGELQVQLPDSDEYKSFPAGTEFSVKADQNFQLKVSQATAYLCFYG